MPGRILVVDDDPHVQITLREALKAKGFESLVLASAEAALERLKAEPFDAVLLDVNLEGMSGMDALPAILRLDADMPVILITAYGSREMAYQAIQKGAYDFFEKPFKIEELAIVVRRALERRTLVREVSALLQRLSDEFRPENLIAQSHAMRAVLNDIRTVFNNDVTVLLRGENGTGKTLLARVVHENSARRAGPFATVTCASIPEGLLESELFGYEPGAFTGAVGRKPGKLELANTGTVFLDEIGDLSPAIQAKLLRVLEQRECERLGGTETVHLDVRIITATNRDLEKAVEEKAFRQDLYFRLNVYSVTLPPLRERKEDIPPLVEHFVAAAARSCRKRVTGFSADAMQLLLTHYWPGNVRELENVVTAAVLRAQGDIMDPASLPSQIITYKPRVPDRPAIQPGRSLDETLASIERQCILDALRWTGGVQSRAAKLLGLTERSLWHRVKKHGINVDGIKDAPFQA
ncbi:MAG: sigma-54-dependent Fis family transcriptional regulator [Planctomycetes bacterium]|nr:sigma-54-dependent Fis family transcriptional regulator [Planctomycetota bacterium]